jgi:hypothetical protein
VGFVILIPGVGRYRQTVHGGGERAADNSLVAAPLGDLRKRLAVGVEFVNIGGIESQAGNYEFAVSARRRHALRR